MKIAQTVNMGQELSSVFLNPFVLIFSIIWVSILITILIVKWDSIKSCFHKVFNDLRTGRQNERLIKKARTDQEKQRLRSLSIIALLLVLSLGFTLLFPIYLISAKLIPSGIVTIIMVEAVILIMIPLFSVVNKIEKMDETIKKRLNL